MLVNIIAQTQNIDSITIKGIQGDFKEQFENGVVLYYKRMNLKAFQEKKMAKLRKKFFNNWTLWQINDSFLPFQSISQQDLLKNFAFTILPRTGLFLQRQLVVLKKQKQQDQKNSMKLISSQELKPILDEQILSQGSRQRKNIEKGISHQTLSYQQQESQIELASSNEFELLNNSQNQESSESLISPQNVQKSLNFISNDDSSTLITFKIEFGIFEPILNYFAVGLVKKRNLIESILLFTPECLVLIVGYTLSEDNTPMKVNEEYEYDRSRWVIANKSIRRSSAEFFEKKLSTDTKIQIKGSKITRIYFDSIQEMHSTRFWLHNCGLEIVSEKKSYFIVSHLSEREQIFNQCLERLDRRKLKKSSFPLRNQMAFVFRRKNPLIFRVKSEKITTSVHTKSNQYILQKAAPMWEHGILSNFEYISLLNMLSGRSYIDLSQYPVFPWIISDYQSKYGVFNFMDSNHFRDLSKPLGAITTQRAEVSRARFEQTKLQDGIPPFHYGSHYSIPILPLHYMIRLYPFSKFSYQLQGGKFDLSDRLFHDFAESWNLATEIDYKEIIPELFYMPEIFLNLNQFEFGKNHISELVNDVQLPAFAYGSPRLFVKFMRKALESPIVHQNLNQWIDLVFGDKQNGKNAVNSLNVFYFLTYENSIDINSFNDQYERMSILDQINEYGQTPRQLFLKPHIQKKKMERPKCFWYNIKSLMKLKPYLILQQTSGKSIKDFFLKDCTSQFNFEQKCGLGAFSRRELSQELQNLQNLTYCSEGECLFGSSNYILNYSNSTDSLLLFSKNLDKGFLFSNELGKEQSNLTYSQMRVSETRKWQAFGDTSGSIRICKLFYDFEKKTTQTKRFLMKQMNNQPAFKSFYSDRNQLRFSQLADRKAINDIRLGQNNQNESKFIIHNQFSPVQLAHLQKNSNNNLILKGNNKSENKNEDKKSSKKKVLPLIEQITAFKSHLSPITALCFCLSYEILISGDQQGIICLWDLSKDQLIKKCFSHHYVNNEIYFEIVLDSKNYQLLKENGSNHYKSIIAREPIIQIENEEKTGDFLILSQNYFSVYSINGVLISVINRQFEIGNNYLSKFSSCLIVNNNERYEDNYIIVADSRARISFWILKPSKITNFSKNENPYFNLYNGSIERQMYLQKVVKQFNLKCIHILNDLLRKTPSELLKCRLKKMWISSNQQTMYTLLENGELYLWVYEQENEQTLQTQSFCNTCDRNFSILEKKKVCPSCYQPYCIDCDKQEGIFTEVNLRKSVRVCEKCFKKNKSKSIVMA